MKHYELLRQCADKLERFPIEPIAHDIILVWPHGNGRFPFLGSGTEKLNETTDTAVYAVQIHRILSGLSRALKELSAHTVMSS